MRTIGTVFLAFLLIPTVSGQEKQKKKRGKFTVGKDTTYATGPLDKEGYVDYVAALNDRLARGVTAENNANVLLWKALGPRPERATMPAEIFRRLGIPAPAERGDYFLDLFDYLKEHTNIDPRKAGDAVFERLERAMRRPWTAKDHPHLADWLKANEKPLAVAVEASKRSHYYSPLVPARAEQGQHGSLLPAVQRSRAVTSALAARAMLRAEEGDANGAWKDLLACHRLGRLIARGTTVIEFLVGTAIDGFTARADLAFLERTKPDAQRIEGYLRDLQRLPAFPAVADKVDLGERFAFLDAVTRVNRYGARVLEGLAGGAGGNMPELGERVLRDVDWEPALRTANGWYDRVAAAMREPDRPVREKKLRKADDDLRTLKGEVSDIGTLAVLLDGKQTGQVRGKLLGDLLITLLMPALSRVQQAADRAQQIQDNLTLAFALEGYRREKVAYPKTLDALAPRYVRQIPRDLFSGKALIYRPTAGGYLLYSVGVNGQDEGGRGYDDQLPGDDLAVRMPPPKR